MNVQMRKPSFVSMIAACAAPLAVWMFACGGTPDDSAFDSGAPPGQLVGGDGGTGPGPFFGGEGGAGSEGGGPAACVDGLCKQQVTCSGGASTTVSGTVFDPAGNTPLYNVLVYVPNYPDKVEAIKHGASCDRCGSVSGSPLVSAITDTQGKFTLKDVPVGADIPLIIQVGKWRRQLKLPAVAQCVDNPLTDKNLTRLPRNQSEGDIPLIALTTGGADTLECFLRSKKLGLDDAEFTNPGGGGSINFYTGAGGASSKFKGGANFPVAKGWWDDPNNLMKYDLVLLSCEGGNTHPENKSQTAYDAMYQYTSAGGRMFATHWHRVWFTDNASMNTTGTWSDQNDPNGGGGIIDDSFPKGQAFRDWLVNVGASTTPKQITISQPRDNVQAVNKTVATQWVTNGAGNIIDYMTANTPIGAADDKICGRAVFSDMHVGGASNDQTGQDWPSGCTSTGLSPQEKALEFLLFDLSSCVQSDTKPPAPPPPGVK